MKKNSKKYLWRAVLVCAIVVFAACIATIIITNFGGKTVNPDDYVSSAQDTTQNPADTSSIENEPNFVDNPVDFDSLQKENDEIYAWIRVPGTNVDYPILRSKTDDNFYLNHAYDGSYSVSGSVFTQSLNSMDFSDRNTLIYGHYMIDGTFFGTLHYFRDETFFDQNDTVLIYTPGHIFTYKVFAAYEYDDRHILNSFDFSNDDVYRDYLSSCLNPLTVNKNVREGTKLTTNDKIITLSTCTTLGEATIRYLVQGVLLSDEPTK